MTHLFQALWVLLVTLVVAAGLRVSRSLRIVREGFHDTPGARVCRFVGSEGETPSCPKGTVYQGATIGGSSGLQCTKNENGDSPQEVGTPALAEADVHGGRLLSLRIIDPGSGYAVPPSVRVFGGGQGARLEAVVEGGRVMALRILEPGYGFHAPPLIQVDPPQPVYRYCHLCCNPDPSLERLTSLKERLEVLERVMLQAAGTGAVGGDEALKQAARSTDPRYRAVPVTFEIQSDGTVACGQGPSIRVDATGVLVVDGVPRPRARLLSDCSLDESPVLPPGATAFPSGRVQLASGVQLPPSVVLNGEGQLVVDGTVRPDWVVRPDGQVGPAIGDVPPPPRPSASNRLQRVEIQEKAKRWNELVKRSLVEKEEDIRMAKAFLEKISAQLDREAFLAEKAIRYGFQVPAPMYDAEYVERIRWISKTADRAKMFLETTDDETKAACLDRWTNYPQTPEDARPFEETCAVFPARDTNPDAEPRTTDLEL